MWGWGDAESGSFLPLPCRGLALAACLGLVLWLILDTSQRPEQLVSFAGICVFISLLFACSKHHRAVSAELSGPAWAAAPSLPALLGLATTPGSQTPPGFTVWPRPPAKPPRDLHAHLSLGTNTKDH